MTQNKRYPHLLLLLLLLLSLNTQLKAVNYYSYQSGAWNNLTTWTTDPSGTTLIGSAVPANSDAVTILDGITVTLTANVTTTGNTLNIRPTGVLNLSTFQITNVLSTFSGSGMLRIGASFFPGATTNTFVAPGGGTTEYYNFGGAGTNLPTQAIYNNLIISNNTVTNNTVRFNNPANPTSYTINGNLSLLSNSSGTVTLIWGNLATNIINASIGGNTTVGSGCAIRVGNFNAIHNISFNGDVTNNGIMRFTNQASPVSNAYYTAAATTTGAANISFTGTNNNTLSCNGVSDFYVFILNKGIDQTYTLTVNSTNVANFALYGPNNGASANKALYMIAGSLKLNSNISIPSLTEGGIDFGIPETCSLWINGATVSTTIVGLNGTGYQALSVFGQIRISAGSMSSGDAAGLVCWSTNSPEIIVEGTGILDVSQIWTTAAIGIETYIQTGGTTNIRANGEVHGGPMFQFNSNNSVVNISGGTINFLNGIFTPGQGIDIQSAPGNFSITGGIININEPGGTDFGINSTIPFYNLAVSRQSGAGNNTITLLNTSASTIGILNNLTLNANTLLNANTNTVNLSIGGDFNIGNAATYTPGNTTTSLNGNAAQILTLDGTITTGLYNFTIAKSAGVASLAGTSLTLAIRNNISITSGTLADGGKTIDVKGNVINSGTHSGAGKISLTGTNIQTIGGNGSGIFQNLELNNSNAAAAPVTLLSGQSVLGALTLTSNKILDLGINNLSLGSASTIVGTPGSNRFIRTAGFRSDGGLSKTFSTNSFTFPIGTAADYTPATITFSTTPTAYGTITVRPVANEHPNVTVTGRSLTYYWRTTSSGFTLGAATVSQNYTYAQSDVVAGGNVSEAQYVPARYNSSNFLWANTTLADINTGTNVITFQGATFNNLIDGDYTAGDNNPTNPFGTVIVYYSRVNTGNWETAATWSVDQVLKWAGAASVSVPTATSPVIIGNGTSFNHTITVTANNKLCGSLEIGFGSVLNLATTSGHNFNTYLTGNAVGIGTLRISSSGATAQFPAGDFGLFLGQNGGTVDYFNTGAQDFTIPLTSAAPTAAALGNYYNLTLSPTNNRTITLPNRDLTIYNNLTILGASATARALINATATRTLSILGNLNVNAGNFQFQNGTIQNMLVTGNVSIAGAAIFDVANSGTGVNNTLSINGSLTNNGIFDMRANATRICNLTFTGSSNNLITGTIGTLTELNLLTINKGNSQTPELNVDVAGTLTTPSDSWLNIQNGTFKFSKTATLTLTNVGGSLFTIAPTAQLSVNNSSAIINIGNVASDASDLILAGKLQILSGTVNIGNTANATNNDIEYSGSGFPEIELQGGTLNVNGQIRKSAISTAGALVYKQSGASAVTIFGQNQLAGKSKLQINTSGSVFNMSGTSTLTIVRGGGTTYQDLYLQAASSTVTGGTIFLGNTATPAATTFQINCINPLFNLVVDATTNTKTAQLIVNPITIKNDLNINGNSVFNANGLNVNIGRNFTNSNTTATTGLLVGGYRPGTAAQTTTFNGSLSNQSIAGVAANLTNFANLVIANSFSGGSVSLSSNSAIRVNGTLTISSNSLTDGTNAIDVVGNIVNNASHLSSGAGRINMLGTSNQIISGNGNGIFGNVTLNNSAGVTMSANSTINGALNFNTNCTFNINDKLLTLGTTATIVGNNANRYIETNGVASDLGVRKNFASGIANFTFAIGVAPKYTPAQFNITANSAVGTITVKPINSKHPGTTDALAKELAFYWLVSSSGFSGLTVTQTYNYIQGDVFGIEANYVTGRNLSGLWTPLNGIPASVNAAANTMTIAAVNYLNGDYTAGEASEFAAPLVFYSRNARTSNNWNNTNSDTWSNDPILKHTGAAVATTPSVFNAVEIAAGHTIVANGDFRKCATLNLMGTLDLSNNVGHDLGAVSGSGTLRIASTPGNFYAFPSGNFVLFTASNAGTFEFNTSTTASMPLQAVYNNLRFTGSGTSTLANLDLLINGNLNIVAGTVNNSINNKNIDLKGNWANTGNSFMPGTGTVTLSGGGTQSLSRTGGEVFYNLVLSGASAKTLGSSIHVNNDLTINSNLDVDAIGNHNISLMHNWVNNGTFLQQQGAVSFIGNTAQSISGATTFYDLIINNTSGGVSISSGAQNLISALDLANGVFTTSGQSFTLLSTSSATAHILPVTGGNLVGNVTMQRYVPAGLPGWFLLGSPVQSSVIEDWDDDLILVGFPGVDGYAGSFVSAYTYNETIGGLNDNPAAYIPATNSTNNSPTGTGFWIWMADNLTTLNANTIDVTGPPEIGNKNLNVSFTSSGGIANDGWNLVANPYCSTIDWDAPAWTKSSMDNATYIYHGTTQQYASYVAGVGTNGGSRYIPSSQGFYVKANAAAPVLIATENIKASTNPSYLKQAASNNSKEVVYITCEGISFTDETALHFTDSASLGFDSNWDAVKLFSDNSQNISLSTRIALQDLSINSLPKLTSSITIPLRAKVGTSGQYTLSFRGLESLSASICITLEDTYSGVITNLRNQNTFAYFLSDTANKPRFLIQISNAYKIETTPSTCGTTGSGKLIITGNTNSIYALSNMQGTIIKSSVLNAGVDTVSNLNIGQYLLLFTDSSSACISFADTVEIEEGTSVVASFNMNTASVLPNQMVSFSNQSNGASYYSWNFGDNSPIDTSTHPTHSYAASGVYTVTLTAGNTLGCAKSFSRSIIVENPTAVQLLFGEEGVDVVRNELGLFVHYSFVNSTLLNVSVFNLIGEKLCEGQTEWVKDNGSFALKIPELPSGIYLAEFHYDNMKVRRKFWY
ncbi:MAG: PKD domain-containing protein [Bacteroidetes bacterium]|nr:PKD domain-containing protein [Bacteroidota bacterium]